MAPQLEGGTMTGRAEIYVTNRKGDVSCWPLRSATELEQRVMAAYRSRYEAVAYDAERNVIGGVEKDPDNGRLRWWFDQDSLPATN